jgi:hypothetical protein
MCGEEVAVYFCVLNFIIELTLKALSWCASVRKCFDMCDEFPDIVQCSISYSSHEKTI